MLESALITLREGFEAALIVAILLAYLRSAGSDRGVRAVWFGVGSAAGVSLVAGVGLVRLFGGLEGAARLRAFAVVAFLAAAVLTWMIFWMRRHARGLKGELEGELGRAISEGSMLAVASVAFFAVLREGLETALFMTAAATGPGAGEVIGGGLIGLAVAVTIALAIYVGGRRVQLRRFFTVTGWLLIVFAAGLVARGVQFLQASGDLGSVLMAAYDLTGFRWLTVDTQTGRFLAGILGWDPRPSLEQVVVYAAYLVPVAVAFMAGGRAMRPEGRRTATA